MQWWIQGGRLAGWLDRLCPRPAQPVNSGVPPTPIPHFFFLFSFFISSVLLLFHRLILDPPLLYYKRIGALYKFCQITLVRVQSTPGVGRTCRVVPRAPGPAPRPHLRRRRKVCRGVCGGGGGERCQRLRDTVTGTILSHLVFF